MPSRLASDRPIKNVIGSVNQTLLRHKGGQAGRLAGGGGVRVAGQQERVRGEWKESVMLSVQSREALSDAYRGVQLLCFVVCL